MTRRSHPEAIVDSSRPESVQFHHVCMYRLYVIFTSLTKSVFCIHVSVLDEDTDRLLLAVTDIMCVHLSRLFCIFKNMLMSDVCSDDLEVRLMRVFGSVVLMFSVSQYICSVSFVFRG